MLTKDEISFRGTTFVPIFRLGKQTLIMIKTRKQPSKNAFFRGSQPRPRFSVKGRSLSTPLRHRFY